MIATIGIDLAKTVLHAVAMDAGGRVVQRRRLDRGRLLEWLAIRGRAWSAWRPAPGRITSPVR